MSRAAATRKRDAAPAPAAADLFSRLAAEQPQTEANRRLAEAMGGGAPKARGGKPRPFRLTPEPPKERPEQRSVTQHLNTVVPNGLCIHVANEGLWSFIDQAIEDPKARGKVIGRLKQAMLRDGFLEGMTDNVLFRPLPARWREILVAAGEDVPELVALAHCFEVKRPGWRESGDKRFRTGKQPIAHALLRRAGVPVSIVRDAMEAEDAAVAQGIEVRGRRRQGTPEGGSERSDVADPPEA